MHLLNPRKRGIQQGQPGSPANERAKHGTRRASLAFALVALTFFALQVITSGAALQEEPAPAEEQATPANPDPPGTIDGAKNPELIPDEVALRMMVLAFAEPNDANEYQRERARAKINTIGFSEDDSVAFLALLSEFRAQADVLDKSAYEILVRFPIPHPASTEYAQLLELGKQRSHLLTHTVKAIPARLTDVGLARIQAYLPIAKRGMKAFPGENP